ncbi:nucleoside-diphosphate sugar epimerase [Croceicoccus ponticola]|uniref:Nucleoside-diphosphate sugar epimerase n=1 Tax=Croceicoccus ponticola TaxID=2217664 RepID=A0A437GWR9_9SPHN|nr:NAD(P)H-binding protein [Croceicoccus ponticola]RVQ65464.1 nucleoside-diphosphate sugar epimerase [Croceicoccus ponticola]
MSEAKTQRMVLIGATGLVGMSLIAQGRDFPHVRLTALARREAPLPDGARMEMIIADPANWPGAIADMKPDVLACALGTTWQKAGKDEQAFRAVDYGLVLQCAKAAAHAGTRQMVTISSVGADPHAKSFYLRVKGELEEAIKKLDFQRVDILRPGLLRGHRGDDRRTAERLAIAASPLLDVVLHGQYRRFRSIGADDVARAMLALAGAKSDGRFLHDNDGIHRAPVMARAQRGIFPVASSLSD